MPGTISATTQEDLQTGIGYDGREILLKLAGVIQDVQFSQGFKEKDKVIIIDNMELSDLVTEPHPHFQAQTRYPYGRISLKFHKPTDGHMNMYYFPHSGQSGESIGVEIDTSAGLNFAHSVMHQARTKLPTLPFILYMYANYESPDRRPELSPMRKKS